MKEKAAPETLQEAITLFANPKKVHDFMCNVLWPDGKVKCPHCGSTEVGKFSGKRMVSNCKSCKKQFTVKIGTIFGDSPLPLSKWLPAVWLIVNAKNGISSYEIGRSLGVTQKTGWFMLHRIRLALKEGTFSKMGGSVESDETFIGGRDRFRHKGKKHVVSGWKGKTAVQGLLERTAGGKASRVKLKVLKTTRNHEVQGNVREYVLKGSELHTDALRSYIGMNQDYVHQVIDHAICYAKGHVHTNGLENFWCLLKRTIKGTYVNCEPFHLFRYLDEQAFRFNERKDTDGGRFMTAIKGIVGKGLKYVDLIGKGGEDLQPA
ncbi:IS1595 family transposase [Methylacidiphilales bacterium]|nr:IS1595 family transposase [Candidatus Methylacidiphilales bacterium]MDB4793488.1 IS1595 family transposase [Candidatus Methylacidiphilales bacterium]